MVYFFMNNFEILDYLFHYFHFINQPFRIGEFIDDEKDVFRIHHDISGKARVVINIAHCSFPLSVEIQSD